MPNAPRIFKRLSELLDVTGETGVVYVTGGTASFLSTTGSGDIVLSASPQFTGTAIFADAQVNGSLAVVGGITAATVAATFTGDGSGLSFLNAGSITSGTLAVARGGTGVSNAGTLTNASNTTITGGGTLALGGFTLTVPATGTVALLTATQTLTNKTLTSPTLTAPVLGAATATSLTTSGQILAAAGNAGAPGISFSALTTTGFYTDGSSDVLFIRGGVDNFKIRSTGILIHQNNALFWGGNGSVGSPDTSLSRNAAGIVQFGTGTIGSAGSWTATNGTLSGTLAVTGASTFTGALTANGGAGIGTAATSTSFLAIVAGTTAKSQMNLAVSTAPTSPVDGDIWREDNTNTGLKIRVNGVTKTITLS